MRLQQWSTSEIKGQEFMEQTADGQETDASGLEITGLCVLTL